MVIPWRAKDFPAQGLRRELVAYARANKEKMTVASAGNGQAPPISAPMLFQGGDRRAAHHGAVQGRGTPPVIDPARRARST